MFRCSPQTAPCSLNVAFAAEPEPLTPHLQLTAAMLINVIGRGGDVFGNVRALVFDNHEPRARQLDVAHVLRREQALARDAVEPAGVRPLQLVRVVEREEAVAELQHAAARVTLTLTLTLLRGISEFSSPKACSV